jgi:hypothetical protein
MIIMMVMMIITMIMMMMVMMMVMIMMIIMMAMVMMVMMFTSIELQQRGYTNHLPQRRINTKKEQINTINAYKRKREIEETSNNDKQTILIIREKNHLLMA